MRRLAFGVFWVLHYLSTLVLSSDAGVQRQLHYDFSSDFEVSRYGSLLS